MHFPFHNLTSYNFSYISEFLLLDGQRPDGHEKGAVSLDAFVVMETVCYKSNYRMILQFEDVRDVIIRGYPLAIDTDVFGLFDIEYHRKWVEPVTGFRLDDAFLRPNCRFQFGEDPSDPECPMSLFARNVTILVLEQITERLSRPILSEERIWATYAQAENSGK